MCSTANECAHSNAGSYLGPVKASHGCLQFELLLGSQAVGENQECGGAQDAPWPRGRRWWWLPTGSSRSSVYTRGSGRVQAQRCSSKLGRAEKEWGGHTVMLRWDYDQTGDVLMWLWWEMVLECVWLMAGLCSLTQPQSLISLTLARWGCVTQPHTHSTMV